MVDEFFRDMDDFASSDIIYSMREQMTPSDEVVSSLLAKIAECDASPERFENSVPFEAVVKKSPGRKPLVKYATVAAASVIVLVSAFAVFGNGSPSDIGNLIDNVVPGNVITTPDPAAPDNPSLTDGDNSGKDTPSKQTDKMQKDDSSKPAADNKTTNTDSAKSGKPVNTGSDDSTAPAPNDNSTPAVGKDGNGDVDFSREILAEESVSHLAISGGNYVVETSSTSLTTTSEIKSISLAIPETSTTNEAVVQAQVKRLRNVSSDLMVAVDVDGFKQSLLYLNESYTPSSLEQFIADAGLDTDVSYSKYVYCKGENIGYSSYHKFSVPDIREYVDNYIFSNDNSPLCSSKAYNNAGVHVTFKSKSNPTCSSIDFGVSDNGYLLVKMNASKSFVFYIGADNASNFIASVTGE